MKELSIICLLAACAVSAHAQQSGSSMTAAAPAKIQVNAPFAEQLIVKEKAMHPEIQKLGLHAVPPGETHNVIVANNLPEKVGKVSSPSDMMLVASGKPVAVRKEEGKFFDTFVPLHDRTGQVIGFLVMEVPFATASTQAAAIRKGTSIRDEVQQQTPTLETLFGPAS